MVTIASTTITAVVTLLICLITNAAANSKTRALMEFQLTELTKKVEKHNQLIERTYKLEKEVVLHEEKLKVANHRIDDLEKHV